MPLHLWRASVLFPSLLKAVPDMGLSWEAKEPKVSKLVDRLHPKLKKNICTDFTACRLTFVIIVAFKLTLFFYRSLAVVDHLALHELHLNNFHNLTPYFV